MTREEYRKQIEEQTKIKEPIEERERERHDRVAARLPKGADKKKWVKSENERIKAEMEALRPEYEEKQKQGYAAADEKKARLMADAEQKLAELNAKKDQLRAENKPVGDLWGEIEAYEAQIDSLKQHQSFVDSYHSFRGLTWEIRVDDYEPYREVKGRMKGYEEDLRDLVAFEEVEKKQKLIDQKHDGIRRILGEKQAEFDKLNGWQQFWAKVLPASWYDKAAQYQDIKTFKAAMADVGVSVKKPEPEPVAPVKDEGQPFPKDRLGDLTKATEPNPPAAEAEPALSEQASMDKSKDEVGK